MQREIEAVLRERVYAEEKWGTDFDDNNTINDWIAYATMYASDAPKIGNTVDQAYGYLIKAAGLLMEAAMRVRENRIANRHYESINLPGLPWKHGEGTAWKESK